ncbi:MAG: hypothetical protein H0W45_06175 [Acidobacteria bacterium]|nr:hypothetical protein [Acidobacteriota bacterium]
MSKQQSHTRGKQSTAQKRDSSRHGFGPIPATSKVDGASGGNQPTGRTAQEVNEHFTKEEMRERGEKLRNEYENVGTTEEDAFNPVIESIPEKTK